MANPTDKQTPGVYRRRIGDALVTTINDGFLDITFDILRGATPADMQGLMRDAFRDGPPRLTVNAFVIETPRNTILVDTGGGVFSHPVGMAVHDDGEYSRDTLRPGHVFSIDPQLRVPEEKLYIRYEDVIVITVNGYENFTDFLPSELDEIEKLVGKKGLLQSFPPL